MARRRAVVTAGLGLAAGRVTRSADRLRLLSPRRRLSEAHRQLAAIDREGPAGRCVERAGRRLAAVDWRSPSREGVQRAAAKLGADRRQLDALSPARVLDRGYAVVRIPGGAVVRRAAQVGPGQAIDVQLAAGRLSATVEEVSDARR